MYDLLLQPGVKRLISVLEILKEQSDEIRSVQLTVFFEKEFWKLENP